MNNPERSAEQIIMNKIKSLESWKMLSYVVLRSGISMISIVVCIWIVQLIFGEVAEHSVLQVFNFSDLDDELIRKFLVGEFVTALKEVPLAYWVTIVIGFGIGILVASQIIRSIPYLSRKLNALRKI